MDRVLEIGLIGAFIFAVAAFGGTEPLLFSVVQVLLFGLACVLVWSHGSRRATKRSFPVAGPFLLVAFIVLQVFPLPSSLVEVLRTPGDQTSAVAFTTLSIVPHDTLSHLLLLLTYLAAFYLTLEVCKTRVGKKRVVYAMVALGAFEAFGGMILYLIKSEKIFTYTRYFPLEGAAGTYINHNHFAGFLEMVLPFTLVIAFFQMGGFQHLQSAELDPARKRNQPANYPLAFFWFFLTLILFTALFLSHSRMGILSGFASIITVGIMISLTAKKSIIGLVLVALLLGATGSMVVWIGSDPIITRFGTLEHEILQSESTRWAIWEDTLQMLPENPWMGIGLGAFPVGYTRMQTVHLNKFVNHAHNDYLEVFSEVGLLGGLLIFGPIFYLLVRTFLRARAAEHSFDQAIAFGCGGSLLAILFHSLADFNLYIPANALVFAIILGLAHITSDSSRTVVVSERG